LGEKDPTRRMWEKGNVLFLKKELPHAGKKREKENIEGGSGGALIIPGPFEERMREGKRDREGRENFK